MNENTYIVCLKNTKVDMQLTFEMLPAMNKDEAKKFALIAMAAPENWVVESCEEEF